MFDFLLGALLTLATIISVRKFIITDSVVNKNVVGKPIYRQSHLYSLIYMTGVPSQIKTPDTQSYRYDMKSKMRVVYFNNMAYWIKDNSFYQANLVDGMVDESSTKVVDIMGMDKVELDQMIFIVQRLTEGITNDGGSTGL